MSSAPSPSYSKVKVLGRGTYGKVYKATSPTGEQVAIKRLYCATSKRYDGILYLRELEFTMALEHPYLIACKGVVFDEPFTMTPKKRHKNDKVYFLLELARCNCDHLIYKAPTTPVSHFKRGMYQLVSAVYYLHQHGVIHRDIKPNNILCCYKNGLITMKICDFGTAKRYNASEANSTYVSHMQYKAPELLLENDNYGKEIDIWALACVFFEMIAKANIFPKAATKIGQLEEICAVVGTPTKDTIAYLSRKITPTALPRHKPADLGKHMALTPKQRAEFDRKVVDHIKSPGTFAQFTQMLTSMLVIDPRYRATAEELLDVDFFSNIDIDKQEEIVKEDPILSIDEVATKESQVTVRSPPYFSAVSLRKQVYTILRRLEKHPRTMFLALDIMDRVIGRLRDEPGDKIAFVIGYMAAKYVMVDEVLTLWHLFKMRCDHSERSRSILEKHILVDLLQCRLYRPMTYDVIHNEGHAVNIDVLWEIMIWPGIDGLSVSEIAEVYIEQTSVDSLEAP